MPRADRKKSSVEERNRVRQQEALAAMGNAALVSEDNSTFVAKAARLLADTLDVDYVAAWELEPEGKSLLLRTGCGWRHGFIGRVRVGINNQSPAGLAVMAGEPVVFADLNKERRFMVPPFFREHGIVSGVSVPVLGHPRSYGALSAHTIRCRTFTTDEVLFLRSAANVIAAAIRNQQADRAVRDGVARLRAVVDTAVEGIITIDESGKIETINPAGCLLFDYAAEELIGRNIRCLMPEPYQSQHDGYLAAYCRTRKAKIIGIGREVVGLRKDGTTFPLDLSVSEFNVGGRRMFAGVVRDITDRRRMEREILEAAAQEQQRIGQDLHDGLCQELTGVSFAMEVLGQKLAARAAPETTSIRKVAELVDQAISHARNLAHGLQPVTLDASGLASALQELAVKTENLFRVPCLFLSDGPVLVYDNVVATHVFRIAQEAIGNAIKHGKAKTLVMDLSAEDGRLRLSITDDGVGLTGAAPSGKGIGMQTMLYRARVAGGNLEVKPGERGGTMVVVTVPLAMQDSSSERSKTNGGENSTHPKNGSGSQTPAVRRPQGDNGRKKAANLSRRRPSDRSRTTRRADRPGGRP
jgi:PAS domain S-box-containing protein